VFRITVLIVTKSYNLVCGTNVLSHPPWSRVIPEKLTGSQLVKKFPAFYGT